MYRRWSQVSISEHLVGSALNNNRLNLQVDDIGDREYSLYDDNMSGSDTDESGEDDSADAAPLSSPFSQYQLPSTGMGRSGYKILYSHFSHLMIEYSTSLRYLMFCTVPGSCEFCGRVGVKHAFYSKSKRFCTLACSRSYSASQKDRVRFQTDYNRYNLILMNNLRIGLNYESRDFFIN